jgi:hypothetical protein
MTTDNFCVYLQNRLIQTSQTGDQWYSGIFPLSIPCMYERSSLIALASSDEEKKVFIPIVLGQDGRRTSRTPGTAQALPKSNHLS